MRKLSTTIAQLAAMRAMGAASVGTYPDRLQDLHAFGSNPGELSAKIHIPASLPERPALVVVLHGCTQTAGGYDHGSGWSKLADNHGFVLLFPEQQRANNPNLCFNWFSPSDTTRDRGEAYSIRQMIAAMVDAHDIDTSRIFVTGLSAGGAMTSVLLATYPEIFAGGAIIAGLPYGAASTIPEALQAMRSPGPYGGRELGDRVRRASGHAGAWPRISIWHGTADATVSSKNADASLAQWLSVHDLDNSPTVTETIAGHRHRIWTDADGRAVVEDYHIANMGHGTPLGTTGAEACGNVMPHMLEAGISSTRRIAAAWNLMDQEDSAIISRPMDRTDAMADIPGSAMVAQGRRIYPDRQTAKPVKNRVHAVIEDALRAAGLMR